MITIREINEDNFGECLKLEVEESQKTFVAPNIYSLAQAWLYPNNARPFTIYNDEEMVGFLMLDIDYHGDGSNVCGLWRFMIDKKYQGQGYGKAAMEELIKKIKKDMNPATFRTSVVQGNQAAENLYSSLGFKLNGEFDGDEKVMIMEL